MDNIKIFDLTDSGYTSLNTDNKMVFSKDSLEAAIDNFERHEILGQQYDPNNKSTVINPQYVSCKSKIRIENDGIYADTWVLDVPYGSHIIRTLLSDVNNIIRVALRPRLFGSSVKVDEGTETEKTVCNVDSIASIDILLY